MTNATVASATKHRTKEIRKLIDEVTVLRDSLLAADQGPAVDFSLLDAGFRDSARNLIHYLALRRHDVRALQERLASLGLSSLGRAESHVLHSIEAVRRVLEELGPDGGDTFEPAAGLDRVHGRRLLQEHTEALMGPARAERGVRIMVTMPGEAAQDYELVHELLRQGMDCMRINCAHDDEAAWARMIEHLRRAEQALHRKCRILMDLAGPKLRTGPLSPGPAVLKVRPQRDIYGRVTAPARLWLTAQEEPLPAPAAAAACLPVPQAWLQSLVAGESIGFRDARQAERELQVTEVTAGGCWAELHRTAYLVPGLKLSRDSAKPADVALLGPLPPREQPLLLREGDLLKLTRQPEPGRPAMVDDDGRILAPAQIACIPAEAFHDVRIGERVLFDDGRIGGVIERTDRDSIDVRITRSRATGSKLRGEKGINLPDSRLRLPAMTAKDLQDLRFVASHADMVALSFANCVQDVTQLREEIARLGVGDPAVVLKIETRRGFENLPEMLLEGMKSPRCGVMIARGDLAVECGFERMAEVQEEILWVCESAHVPVIWATQVLETLAREGLPSRAEITDAAMGDRAECVMLNKGPHIVAAVKALDDILRRMQAHQSKKSPMLRSLHLAHQFPSHAAATGVRAAEGATHDAARVEDCAPNKAVRFGHSHQLDMTRRAVIFNAFCNRQMIPCAITAEALLKQFDARESELLSAFAQHRGAIERLAETLILEGRLEPEGNLVVRAEDCTWLTRIPGVPQPPPAPAAVETASA